MENHEASQGKEVSRNFLQDVGWCCNDLGEVSRRLGFALDWIYQDVRVIL